MDWRIEKQSHRQKTTLRLIGRIHEQNLPSVQMLIDESSSAVVLDLKELLLVDLETVRFLARCQNNGVSLLHGSQYIMDWIAKEHDPKSLSRG